MPKDYSNAYDTQNKSILLSDAEVLQFVDTLWQHYKTAKRLFLIESSEYDFCWSVNSNFEIMINRTASGYKIIFTNGDGVMENSPCRILNVEDSAKMLQVATWLTNHKKNPYISAF